jgi:hypothetical protein
MSAREPAGGERSPHDGGNGSTPAYNGAAGRTDRGAECDARADAD